MAVLGGRVTSSTFDGAEFFYLYFEDNGSPTFGSIGPDQVTQTWIPPFDGEVPADFPEDFPASCPDPDGWPEGEWRQVLGDVLVR